MRFTKLGLAAVLIAVPATVVAQEDEVYDATAPGEPVESVDVFYDELAQYGVWVDEPDVGLVFIPDGPDQDGYVPYRDGHWQYTSVGFTWVSDEPFAWATSHYGRWAFSDNYRRWYWLPDTEWGPAWVDWRQTDGDFGWAPLPPEVVARRGWRPPPEAWHFCSAEHVLDVQVRRYYEPPDRVVVIEREARPIEHYARVSNVRVVVGPPRSVLAQHRVEARPVRVEPRTVGRLTPSEARALVARAQERRATVFTENQRRIEANAKVRDAHARVIEAHPQIKQRVTERLQAPGAPAPRPAVGAPPQQPRPPVEHAPPPRPVAPAPAPTRAEPQPTRPPVEHAPPPRPQPQPQPRPPEPARAEPPRQPPGEVERPRAPAPAGAEPRPGRPAAVEHAQPPPPATREPPVKPPVHQDHKDREPPPQ